MKIAIYTNTEIEMLPDWCNLIIQSVRKECDRENVNVCTQFDDISEIDIILNLSAKNISDELLHKSIHGVLEIQYLGRSIYEYPIGLYEILQSKEVIEINTVLKKSNSSDNTVIEQAFYNPHWYVRKNRFNILSNIHILVRKSLVKILKTNFTKKNSIIAPDIRFTFFDYIRYFGKLVKHIFTKILIEKLNIRGQCWDICIGAGNFIEEDINQIISTTKLDRKRFWADPFLFEYQSELYVFFERFSHEIKKGIISVGKVKDNQIVEVRDVLCRDYHLSYPFIFSEDDNIYMIPECSENKRLEIYRCTEFPAKWELYSTAFEGEGVVDTNYYVDKDKNKWLFLSKANNYGTDLYIYWIDSLEFNKIVPHKLNPVIMDSRVARNAGAIFEYKNKTIRPSQYSIRGIYGKGVCLNEIKILTVDEYEETTIKIVIPNKAIGIHQLHQIKGYFVFDVCNRQLNHRI
jgi:hypothetical protein